MKLSLSQVRSGWNRSDTQIFWFGVLFKVYEIKKMYVNYDFTVYVLNNYKEIYLYLYISRASEKWVLEAQTWMWTKFHEGFKIHARAQAKPGQAQPKFHFSWVRPSRFRIGPIQVPCCLQLRMQYSSPAFETGVWGPDLEYFEIFDRLLFRPPFPDTGVERGLLTTSAYRVLAVHSLDPPS